VTLFTYPEGTPSAGLTVAIRRALMFEEPDCFIVVGYDVWGSSHELKRGSREDCAAYLEAL